MENANPVILDSAGRATIFIDGSYRFDLYDSSDVLVESTDNVTNFTTTGDAEDAFFESFSGDGETVTFTLSESQGTDEKVLSVVTEFEFTTNGDFDTDSDWTKGTGWTIGSGVATASGAISTALEQTAGRTLIEGDLYTVTMTITRSAGGLIPSIGGTSGTERTASGTYTENIIAGSTQTIAFTGNGFTGTVDDVTVTKVSGLEAVSTQDFTINGTSLTFIDPPASGTGNVRVWNYARLAGAASASAAAAATSAANAASSAATSLVGTGFQYGFDSDTTATDPGSGDIKFDNATLSSVTEIYISETTDQSQSIGDVFATWDDSTSTVKGTITIYEQADQTNFIILNLDSITDNGGWQTFAVTYVDSGGSFTADDTLTVKFSRIGDKGDTGSQGPTGDIGGPVSSTDNAVARWNGIGGNEIQDSGVIIDDSDNLIVPANSGVALTEGTAPSTAASQGALYTKDTGGQPELFYREESDGDEVQITSGGALNAGGGLPNNGYAANRYYMGAASAATSSTNTVAADTLYAFPFYVGASETFTRIGFEVTTGAAGNARLGIYEWADSAPSSLVLDAGTVSTSTTGLKEVTISQALSSGVYALGIVFDATPTVRRRVGNNSIVEHLLGGDSGTVSGTTNVAGISTSHTYGALPDPYGTPTYETSFLNSHQMWLRKV